MLKKILEQRNISVYAASKNSGIPYTTLNELVSGKKVPGDCSIRTFKRLAAYLNITIDTLYELSTANIEWKNPWEEERNKKYRFPVICPSDSYDASRIYPLKQKEVLAVTNALIGDERVYSIILFGSSTNIRCNRHSDLDFAVGLTKDHIDTQTKNQVSETVQSQCDYSADIIWLDHIKKGSRIYDSIQNGVVLK